MDVMANYERSALPVLAPAFGTHGPHRPLDQIPVALPLRNLRPNKSPRVLVRFYAEGATVTPDVVEAPPVPAHGLYTVNTVATVLPRNGHRSVSVWAEIDIGPDKTPLVTARASAPILARAALSLQATSVERGVIIVIANIGDEATTATVQAVTTGEAPYLGDDTVLWMRSVDGYELSEIPLAPSERREFRLDTQVERVIAITEDGERTTCIPTPPKMPALTIETPRFALHTHKEGIRAGEIVRWEFAVNNPYGSAMNDLSLALEWPEGLRLLPESLTIDDVRLVSSYCREYEGRTALYLGRLEASSTLVVKGVVASSVARNDARPYLEANATLSGPNIAPHDVTTRIDIDRNTVFAPSHTYLSDLEQQEDGTYLVRAVITNPDAAPSPHLRIRWAMRNVLPADMQTTLSVDNAKEERELPLASSTIDGQPAIITDIGSIPSDGRVEVRLLVKPHPSHVTTYPIGVYATLLAAGATVDLGRSELTITTLPNLKTSTISAENDTLRTGIPRKIELRISNTGDAAATDLRVAIDLPYGRVLGLPDGEPDQRWRSLTRALPAGGTIGFTMWVTLNKPFDGEKLTLNAALDAANHPPLVLDSLTFKTPTQPIIDEPHVTVTPVENGLMRVDARVTNLGDGVARNIVVRAESNGTIVPGTLAVDGVALDTDATVASVITQGLYLGELPAGRYRDVAYNVIPSTDEPYSAIVMVKGDGFETVTARSQRRSPTPVASFQIALPDARTIDETDATPRARARDEDSKLLTSDPLFALKDRLRMHYGRSAAWKSDPLERVAEDDKRIVLRHPGGAVFEEELAPIVAEIAYRVYDKMIVWESGAGRDNALAGAVPTNALPPPPETPMEGHKSTQGTSNGHTTLDAVAPTHDVHDVVEAEGTNNGHTTLDAVALTHDVVEAEAEEVVETPAQPEDSAEILETPFESDKQPHQADDVAPAAEDSEPQTPPAPEAPHPIYSAAPASASQLRRVLARTSEATFGWWPHILALRAFVPQGITGHAELEDTCFDLQAVVTTILGRAFAALLRPGLTSDEFGDEIDKYQPTLLVPVQRLIETTNGEIPPLSSAHELDLALATLFPHAIDAYSVATNEALAQYADELTTALTQQGLLIDEERRDLYRTPPRPSLALALQKLRDALADEEGA